ncbi:NAD(P)/FAD-dependent oxidoreductase [Flavimaricola marinus]|uniref:Gamma-glutamylputrescine oxidoreductase n=1 Tax=Flavimaricola marinus TaxID=1819565 RepID=A0A238LJB0_9RHOB|nr:FAD-binding oxidoreductase [Flavimaricola marinus]SMY09494.1 Gamma-glutamylputrescine oxidoreductase [Flavimaricola marinus]
MNPLYRNDRPGQYPPSWYAASVSPPAPRPELKGETRADVAIVGAGYTGLWAALTLARKGMRVVVLEAHRAGFGASGRNGGQVHSGFNKGQAWLEGKLGKGEARALWDLSEAAKDQLRDFCAAHPQTGYKPGVAHGEYSEADTRTGAREAEHLAKAYGYDQVESFDGPGFADLVKSPLYKGGTLDRGGGHLHPLHYALALAAEAEAAGAVIHEGSEVTGLTHGTPATVQTPKGRVIADHVILAGNGYLPHIERKVASTVMPINSFIAATEPLPERWQEVLAEDISVADSKFVVNYYRFSEDRRFLFGGRESYSIGFPSDIKGALIRRMTDLFPQLSDVKVDYVWGGTLGITVTRLPALQRIAPNVLSGAGFSGQGVALSGMAGRIMAEAVAGQAGQFDVMAKLPVPAFPGGAAFRAPMLTLAMTWFSLRDRLGI